MRTNMYQFAYFSLIISLLASCSQAPTQREEGTPIQALSLTKTDFDTLPDGKIVHLYTLRNPAGTEVSLINIGAAITHLLLPDQQGEFADVVLGFDDAVSYTQNTPHFGAVVGRYGNRIAKGRFSLDGKEYVLAQNNGENHLHGGVKGFDLVYWEGQMIQSDTAVGVRFTYLSPDGEEGYPGNLQAEVTYLLGQNNELSIRYQATTDQPTVVNLTQHTYFNLTGATRDILGHRLRLNATRLVPVDAGLIPTGGFLEVEGTPFDFTDMQEIGVRIEDAHEQMVIGGGYDHCWVLEKPSENALSYAATLLEPTSGRQIDVYTTEPGIQFYSGNFLTGSVTGKGGMAYPKRWGLCLETQHHPDSPNQPQFPTTVLRPGETYRSQTVFRFSVKPSGT